MARGQIPRRGKAAAAASPASTATSAPQRTRTGSAEGRAERPERSRIRIPIRSVSPTGATPAGDLSAIEGPALVDRNPVAHGRQALRWPTTVVRNRQTVPVDRSRGPYGEGGRGARAQQTGSRPSGGGPSGRRVRSER